LIPLFLYQKKKLSQPMFYLSAYLEAHREEYYHHLQGISRHGNWNDWIAFFLTAIAAQARENSLKVREIITLYADMKRTIYEITHSQFSIQVLDAIFHRPIFKTTDFVRETGIHKPTALGLLRQLKEHEVLKPISEGSGRRAAVLCFPALIHIAEGRRFL
jgi:Fic family protein